MRINRSATRKRRSHHALTEPRLSDCKGCGAKHLRHRACNECGNYRGRVVGNIEEQKAKKAAKKITQLEAMQDTQKDAQAEEKTEEKSKDQ